MVKAKYERGEDGLFHCDFPECEQPGYEHPQHLGLHRFHQHGIKGMRYDEEQARRKRGRPPGAKNKPKNLGPLSAEDICRTVLESVSPNGSIPIHAIPQYNEWVAVTGAFLTYLLD